MMLRTVAGDKPSLDILEIVRDPTGSPVVMCVLISSASISRLRSSISDPLLIISTSARELTWLDRAWLDRVRFVHYAAHSSSRRKVPLRQKLCQGAASISSLTTENTGISGVAKPDGSPTVREGISSMKCDYGARPHSRSGYRHLSCKAGEIVLRFSILNQASFGSSTTQHKQVKGQIRWGYKPCLRAVNERIHSDSHRLHLRRGFRRDEYCPFTCRGQAQKHARQADALRMRYGPGRLRPSTVFGEVLPDRDALHSVRYRSGLPSAVGSRL